MTVAFCQIVFLTVGCDWDLCGDEAEYWAWSRRLAWSYYSRGPLIAWLIRLATELLGGLSLKLTGSLMLAVRLPAVLSGGVDRLGSLSAGYTDDRSAAHRNDRRVASAGDPDPGDRRRGHYE